MRKIMFNDYYGLTQAVLEGRKSMTRRIAYEGNIQLPNTAFYPEGKDKNKLVLCNKHFILAKSFYAVGEIVAIAQPYKDIVDNHYFQEQCLANETDAVLTRFEAGWNNKMYVKSYYMPHHIRITDIKVERLQDISEEDCLKEGIQEYFPYIDRNPNDNVRTFQYFKDGKIHHRISPASKCFAHLIDDISGKGTWERNPWVMAYTFELVK